jgi:hypothetical protein
MRDLLRLMGVLLGPLFGRMPWRSTVVPPSVPTSVHVAPDADSGSPALERAASPGVLAGTRMGE